MNFFIKGTDQKVRSSKTKNYKFALVRNYKFETEAPRITCHEKKESAEKVMAAEISEYNRHPHDFSPEYNPNEKGFFEIVELEEK